MRVFAACAQGCVYEVVVGDLDPLVLPPHGEASGPEAGASSTPPLRDAEEMGGAKEAGGCRLQLAEPQVAAFLEEQLQQALEEAAGSRHVQPKLGQQQGCTSPCVGCGQCYGLDGRTRSGTAFPGQAQCSSSADR
jgi:hypothetical protein